MNKNAERYYQTAINYHLPVYLLPDIDGFEIQLGKKRYHFRGYSVPYNDSVAARIARNKYCMNRLLDRAGIPVPKAIAIHVSEFNDGLIEEKIAELTFPLVIKPTLETGKGQDVLCNIQNMELLQHHLREAFQSHEFITIEEFHGNLQSYRVLVFFHKVIGVVRRFPAHVKGDGEHTIRELVAISNQERQATSDILCPILFDAECEIRLSELGLTPDHIPPKGQYLSLSCVSNATRGGTFAVVDKKICKENKQLLIRAARAMNLNFVGFDIECTDIRIPFTQSEGVVIEANGGPSIRIHEESINPQWVSKNVVRRLIYRHPIAYSYALLKRLKIKLYLRVLLMLVFLGSVFKVLL